MKRFLVGSVGVLILVLALSGSAQAKCGIGCLNGKVRKLSASLARAEKTIAAQGQTIAAQGQTIAAQGEAIAAQAQTTTKVNSLYSCLAEVPITEYGDPLGEFGYVFRFENEEKHEPEEVETSALDVTFEGGEVGAWFLIDLCNTAETASTHAASGVFAPAAGAQHRLMRPRVR